MTDAKNKATVDGQVRNWLLKSKMDALAWLARSYSFVSDEMCQQMVSAFRRTEVPQDHIEMRKTYLTQITSSDSIITICDIIKQVLDKRFVENGPEEMQNYYKKAGLESDYIVIQALKRPLNILELLICNDEQAKFLTFLVI